MVPAASARNPREPRFLRVLSDYGLVRLPLKTKMWAKAKLLELYPAFAENARHELQKFNVTPTLTEHVIDGLRKAGLEVPEETH